MQFMMDECDYRNYNKITQGYFHDTCKLLCVSVIMHFVIDGCEDFFMIDDCDDGVHNRWMQGDFHDG